MLLCFAVRDAFSYLLSLISAAVRDIYHLRIAVPFVTDTDFFREVFTQAGLIFPEPCHGMIFTFRGG
jgi:hypothetical protein